MASKFDRRIDGRRYMSSTQVQECDPEGMPSYGPYSTQERHGVRTVAVWICGDGSVVEHDYSIWDRGDGSCVGNRYRVLERHEIERLYEETNDRGLNALLTSKAA